MKEMHLCGPGMRSGMTGRRRRLRCVGGLWLSRADGRENRVPPQGRQRGAEAVAGRGSVETASRGTQRRTVLTGSVLTTRSCPPPPPPQSANHKKRPHPTGILLAKLES